MPRRSIEIYPQDKLFSTVYLRDVGTAGTFNEFIFNNNSIQYFTKTLAQNFNHNLIDNIGEGSIRVTFNRPGRDISAAGFGVKTLLAKDTLYLEEDIWQIGIYYIEDSEVELILKN